MQVKNVQLSGPKSNEAACACLGRFWSNSGRKIQLRFRKCERGLTQFELMIEVKQKSVGLLNILTEVDLQYCFDQWKNGWNGGW